MILNVVMLVNKRDGLKIVKNSIIGLYEYIALQRRYARILTQTKIHD